MRDAALNVNAEPGGQDGTTVLRLAGPLTLANLFGFQDQFRRFAAPVLIVDMSGVEYIDSAGLGLLVNGHVSAENNGRRFALSGVCPRVYTLLELTRVHTVLAVFPSVEAAESALSA